MSDGEALEPGKDDPPAAASLRVNNGPHVGKTIVWTDDTLSIGRAPECDMALPDGRGVSRVHAIIVRADGNDGPQFVLHDEGSRNGTALNGEDLHGQTRLENGDRITVATTHLLFAFPASREDVESSASTMPADSVGPSLPGYISASAPELSLDDPLAIRPTGPVDDGPSLTIRRRMQRRRSLLAGFVAGLIVSTTAGAVFHFLL